MTLLDDTMIANGLDALDGWRRDGDRIIKTYTLPTFHRAIGFVVQIGMLAEVADHHPDLAIAYRKVTVTLSTHSAGGITERDLALAAQIEAASGS